MTKTFIFLFYCGGVLFIVNVIYFKIIQKMNLLHNPIIWIPFLIMNSIIYDWLGKL